MFLLPFHSWPQVEPFFTSLALYDAKNGKKISEDLNIDINHPDVKAYLNKFADIPNGSGSPRENGRKFSTLPYIEDLDDEWLKDPKRVGCIRCFVKITMQQKIIINNCQSAVHGIWRQQRKCWSVNNCSAPETNLIIMLTYCPCTWSANFHSIISPVNSIVEIECKGGNGLMFLSLVSPHQWTFFFHVFTIFKVL